MKEIKYIRHLTFYINFEHPNKTCLTGFDTTEQKYSRSEVKIFQIIVNVDKYKPEELFIKTVDNTVIVEAKHEEKTSDGRSCSTQSFSQSFTLPAGVDPDSVKSALSQQGVLTISAPVTRNNRQQERLVPIKQIN